MPELLPLWIASPCDYKVCPSNFFVRPHHVTYRARTRTRTRTAQQPNMDTKGEQGVT